VFGVVVVCCFFYVFVRRCIRCESTGVYRLMDLAHADVYLDGFGVYTPFMTKLSPTGLVFSSKITFLYLWNMYFVFLSTATRIYKGIGIYWVPS
jgi:hypothetical protein